jgi:crotonobetainyl-CoA:carnitine CoA-transferase CaiB-like acyl-CoA transferase
MTGEEDGGPLPVGVAIADYIGAMNLAVSVIAALYSREKTGRGQKIDTSLFGSAIASQAWELQSYMMGRRKRRGGRGHAYLPTIWRTFQTSDGWAVVGGVGDDRWPAFCAAVAMPELQHDERFKDGLGRAVNLFELYKILDDKFLAKSTKEWIEVLEAHDMICAPAQDYDALMEDPQALENEYLVNVDHPIAGPMQVVGQPWRFSETPANIAPAAPELGQHTEEILLDLGYTWDDITALREKKAI